MVFTALSALGMLGISSLLIVMGRLSQRLGRVTRARAFYIGFYVGAALVLAGAGVRFLLVLDPSIDTVDLTDTVLWVLLYNGAPALGLTIGVIVAWRYWSWLLAERS
ncbi:MAG: hypothetical protein ACOCX5_01800 [Chloroflexota bacterium]